MRELLIFEVIVEALGCACRWYVDTASRTTLADRMPLELAVEMCNMVPRAVLRAFFNTMINVSVGTEDPEAAAWHGNDVTETPLPVVAKVAFLNVSEHRKEELDEADKLSLAAAMLLRNCAQCGHDSHVHKSCALCKQVWYCDKACQTLHWRAGHRA